MQFSQIAHDYFQIFSCIVIIIDLQNRAGFQL